MVFSPPSNKKTQKEFLEELLDDKPLDHRIKPTKVPVFTSEQIEYLSKRFPDRCPHPSWNDRRIWMEAGQRSVVTILRRELEVSKKQKKD